MPGGRGYASIASVDVVAVKRVFCSHVCIGARGRVIRRFGDAETMKPVGNEGPVRSR